MIVAFKHAKPGFDQIIRFAFNSFYVVPHQISTSALNSGWKCKNFDENANLAKSRILILQFNNLEITLDIREYTIFNFYVLPQSV